MKTLLHAIQATLEVFFTGTHKLLTEANNAGLRGVKWCHQMKLE